jgi:hypothetical protein
MSRESVNHSTFKAVILLVATAFVISLLGCSKQPEPKEADRDSRRYHAIDSLMTELVQLHSADTSWYKSLNRKGSLGSIVTLELENEMAHPKGRRIAFVGELSDLYRSHGIVFARFSCSFGNRFTIYYKLHCSESDAVELLASRTHWPTDRFVVVAEVEEVKPLAFEVTSDTLDEAEPITIVDESQDVVASGVLIGSGVLHNIGFVRWPRPPGEKD